MHHRRFDATNSQPWPSGAASFNGRVPPSTYSGVVVPEPPHSLAPMAMSHDHSVSQRGASPTVVTRDRESSGVKTGIGILAVGALLGALLGVGMRVHQNTLAAEAASAAQVNASMVAPAEATPVVPVAVAPGPATAQPTPPTPPAQAYAIAPATPAPSHAKTTIAPKESASKGSSKESAKETTSKKSAKRAPSHVPARSIVAANVPEPPAPKASKAEKEPKADKGTHAETAAAMSTLKQAQEVNAL